MRSFVRRRRGSTLVFVLILAAALSLLAFSTGGVARYASEASLVERDSASLTYESEAALEALRLQLIRHYENSQLAPRIWLQAVEDDHSYRVYGSLPSNGVAGPVDWTTVSALGPLTPPPGSAAVGAASYTALPRVRSWIDLVNYDQGWIELVAATTPDVGREAEDSREPISVRMRLNVYRNAIFDLAMLTETTNCMFCHLHIKGDVGSIGFFRPGWGTENSSGWNSGYGSEVDGDVYMGESASDDGESSPFDPSNNVLEDLTEVNGAEVTGGIYQDYRGPLLPEDVNGDGVPDFPSFDPVEAENRAGSGGGGITVNGAGFGGAYTPGATGMWVVPPGGDWDNGGGPGSGALSAPPASTSVIEGNLVILGSDDPSKPIKIDGNVFVTGDVIIKGYVEGQGAIYAGRNVYVAGDIRYKDLPSGGYPLADDAAGQAAVQEKVSELRLAARNNVVIGDWTYAADDGSIQQVKHRQGQDFILAQHDLAAERYYEAANDGTVVSNELTQLTNGDFVNDLGEVVPVDRVAKVDAWDPLHGPSASYGAVPQTRYDATVAPGNVTRSGGAGAVGGASFDAWMSQSEFREVLGTKSYDVIQYRVPLSNDPAVRAFELGSEWVAANGDSMGSSGYRTFDEDVLDGGDTGLYVRNFGWAWKFGQVDKDPSDGGFEWATQVEHIDAFVFANKRISGKTDRGNLTINGGMAATEIGVLAPGFRNGVFTNSGLAGGSDSVPNWVFETYDPSHASHPKNAYGQASDTTRLYYDYRLRNGGFGFDFLAKTGDTLNYLREGRVTPPHDAAGPAGLNQFPTE